MFHLLLMKVVCRIIEVYIGRADARSLLSQHNYKTILGQ